jgi:hypothetical protein
MKMLKAISSAALCILLIFGGSSCVVIAPRKHDNGKHKGWYKNPNNPHNPASTKKAPGNSGKSPGNSPGNSGKVKKK